MALRQATRKKAKIRCGFSGPSGFGKTYSALLVAKGLAGGWEKVAVIDSENGSADLYSDLGPYNVLPISAPFEPEKYIAAIDECEKAGMEVIIIDSITHEWDGEGGCLDIYAKLGGKYQDWSKITPRHQKFINKILNSPAHLLTTVRRKQDHEMVKDGNGKVQVQKAGMKEITREGFEYELTINFEFVSDQHLARASKDRTGLFIKVDGTHEFKPSEQTGQLIRNWCEQGEDLDHAWHEGVEACATQKELVAFYQQHKAEVDVNPLLQQLISNRRSKINGTAVASQQTT